MSNFLNQFTEKFKNYIDDNLMTTNEMQTKVIAYLNTQEVKDQIIEQYLENFPNLPNIPKRFRMEVEVSAGQVFTMWGKDNSSYTYDGTIDWGDGTVETFTTYNPSHTYTTAGIYEIAISGRFDTLRNISASNTSVQSVRKILSWGDGTVFEGFRILTNGFYKATGLTEIASDTYGGLSNVTSFNSCFRNCSSLTAIPAGLFDYCPNVTNFSYCFYSCNNLVLRGDEYTLSTLAGRTINFNCCFQAQSTSSTNQKVGTAPELWNAGLSASSTATGCFTNRTLLTNYSSIPSAWL